MSVTLVKADYDRADILRYAIRYVDHCKYFRYHSHCQAVRGFDDGSSNDFVYRVPLQSVHM